MPIIKCALCGKEANKPHRSTRYCSHKCYSLDNQGTNNRNWRGGSYTSLGYVHVRAPKGHAYAQRNGYILEHRLIAERKLGRYLEPNELVHHINGIKDDNREDNLIVLTKQEHNAIHLHSIDKTCSIPECGKPHKSLGFCNTHYARYKFNRMPEHLRKYAKRIIR